MKQLINCLFVMLALSIQSACESRSVHHSKAATSSDPSQSIPDPMAVDPNTGLKIAPGWEKVKQNCTACHSSKLIIGQQGDRSTWHSIIRLMQVQHGLKQLDSEIENIILAYLATNYPPGKSYRRANLPASALPPNPWK